MKIKLFFLGIFLLPFSLQISAQGRHLSDEKFLENLALYSKIHPENLLFVHTDKQIYTNNENLWFSAYLIKSESVDFRKHSILSVSLVREDNKKIQLQDKYAMEDGLSHGSMALPDSLPPGGYQLIAYTNAMGKHGHPVAFFTQKLTIKSITESSFSVSATLMDSVSVEGKIGIKIQLEITDAKSRIKPLVSYSLGRGELHGVKVDARNTGILQIAVNELTHLQSQLLVSARYNDQVQYVSLRLPIPSTKGIKIGFFPEGGYLVDGLPCTVGWETKIAENLSVPVTGILFKDDQPIDTITTTSYGIGSFRLTPDLKSRYTLRIENDNGVARDTIYQLPAVIDNGISLHLEQAVVDDTLRFYIESRDPRNLHVLIHDYRSGYASLDMSTQRNRSGKTVVLSGVPRGLSTVTVLDEGGRPLAERIFFAHYDRRLKLSFEGAKKTYTKREKFTTTLKLNDYAGSPVKGVVSIACVQANRIDPNRQQDIESYALLDANLGLLPPDPSGRPLDSRDYLENVLLIKGWRKYTWQGLMRSSGDTSQQIGFLTVKGKARYLDKPLKKPIGVNIIKNLQDFNLYTTDSRGSFEIPYADLLIQNGNFLHGSANVPDKRGYTIELDDPFETVSNDLAAGITVNERGLAGGMQSSKQSVLTGMEHVTQLREVVIKAGGNDSSIYKGKRGSNPCGDYVIGKTLYYPHVSPMYNATKDDPNRRQPVKGEFYHDGIAKASMSGSETGYIGDSNTWEWKRVDVIYQGCSKGSDKSIFKLSGIYTNREFYGFDKKLSDFPDPQLLSTLYWKPGVIVNRDGEIDCTFYTGDITGKFQLVLQGVGSTDLIYGEESFEVK